MLQSKHHAISLSQFYFLMLALGDIARFVPNITTDTQQEFTFLLLND